MAPAPYGRHRDDHGQSRRDLAPRLPTIKRHRRPAAHRSAVAVKEAYESETELDIKLDVAQSRNEPEDEELEAAKKELERLQSKLATLQRADACQKDSEETPERKSGLPMPPISIQELQEKKAVDSRSVYVGNVDYDVAPEELQICFQGCGTINRVTILTDRMGNPKGFAYIEFLEPDAVSKALLLTGTPMHGRQIQVRIKRTNVPGKKQPPRHLRATGFASDRGALHGMHMHYGRQGGYSAYGRGRQF